jgi:hypothetical protein
MQYVYLLESSGYYKIGVANDVADRISQLQTGNPNMIRLVSYYGFENANPVEATLHQRFSSTHKRGEWFNLEKEDIQTFGQLCRIAGGEIGSAILAADEKTIQEIEQEQEFFMDNPDLRIEPRCNPSTGQIRGFAFRERNNGRRTVKYIGIRESPEEFKKILESIPVTSEMHK